MKRALLVVLVVAALVAAAGATATRVRWHGGLGSYGGAVGLPAQVGQPFTIGADVLRARGGRVRIESVRLHGAPPGVEFVGALVHDLGRGMVGAEYGFPPRFPGLPKRVAEGTTVAAHESLALIVGLRATRTGSFRVYGFDVTYRERWHGVDLRRKVHLGTEVDVCAQREPVGRGAKKLCDPPDPVE